MTITWIKSTKLPLYDKKIILIMAAHLFYSNLIIYGMLSMPIYIYIYIL
jgi:hypothetical protein